MNRGFTLLELVVALGVLLAAVLLFAGALSSIPLTKGTRYQNLAYHLAAKKISELRATAFESLPASGPYTDTGLSELPSASAELTVNDYDGNSDLKQINVTITWEDGGETKDLELETLIGEFGLNQ